MFQGLVLQMKEALGRNISLAETSGGVIVSSERGRIGLDDEAAAALAASGEAGLTAGGHTYKPLYGMGGRLALIVCVEGEDELADKLCGMCVVALANIKNYYDEKHDKATFIKNVLLGNILPGDIYARIKELRFDNDAARVVFIIRLKDRTDDSALDMLENMFPDRQKDFVVSLGDNDIALVKEVGEDVTAKELIKLAKPVEETISGELLVKCVIGVGTPVPQLKDISRSFKEAQIAMDIGQVFDADKSIVSYDSLGIGRLIYQLPTTMCEMFIAEIFREGSIDSLDQETLLTITKFFENSLNVSETARKLFVHRNTLVYRLEKIKKLTGLDLREFDHAIVFKVAMMVKKYLAARDK